MKKPANSFSGGITIKITFSFAIAFIALRYSMHEAHELVHTTVGRVICGCWGQRDFNEWSLCSGCAENNALAVVATFAGPLFTYLAIWLGVYFLNPTRTIQQKSFGFVLIFSNNPFARIFTAAIGKGDEVFGLKQIFHNDALAWITGLAVVLIFTVYPLYKAFKSIENINKVSLFVMFLLSPMLLDLLFIFALMNPLLKSGFLGNYWILGSPILLTVFTFLMLTIFIATRKNIFKLAV